jgi:DNA-binding NarL/FixJ family response regulator
MQILIFDSSSQRRALLRHVLAEESWISRVAQAEDYQECLETCATGFRTVVLVDTGVVHLPFARDLASRRYAVLCFVAPTSARSYRALESVRVVEHPWLGSPRSESQQVEAMLPLLVATLNPA